MLNLLNNSRLIIVSLIGIPVFLMIDSAYGDNIFNMHGQAVANVLVFATFVAAYIISHRRAKSILLIGILVGLSGEYLFSKVLGMYHYRYENIPIWLAFGHGLLFALVFRLSRKEWIRKSPMVEYILYSFVVIYSFTWLLWEQDWFGFLCSLIFLLVSLRVKKSRLFFLIMFVIVCYLEQVGTMTGSWYWPKSTFGLTGGLSSGNPPTGIAVFYFIFDAIVLWIYLNILYPKVKHRYKSRYS